MKRHTSITPMQGDVFTEEALASLVGQTVRISQGLLADKTMGHATIVAAEQEGDALRLTFEMDDDVMDRVEAVYSQQSMEHFSVGYRLADAVVRDDEGNREVRDATMMEACPWMGPLPPGFPLPIERGRR